MSNPSYVRYNEWGQLVQGQVHCGHCMSPNHRTHEHPSRPRVVYQPTLVVVAPTVRHVGYATAPAISVKTLDTAMKGYSSDGTQVIINGRIFTVY